MKKIFYIALAITVSGCSSNKSKDKEFIWQEYVVPIQGGEFITDVRSRYKSRAEKYALKAAYGACGNGRPVVLSRDVSRTGLMSEGVSSVYKVAHSASKLLGHWSPRINDEKFTASYRFRCESVKIISENAPQD